MRQPSQLSYRCQASDSDRRDASQAAIRAAGSFNAQGHDWSRGAYSWLCSRAACSVHDACFADVAPERAAVEGLLKEELNRPGQESAISRAFLPGADAFRAAIAAAACTQ